MYPDHSIIQLSQQFRTDVRFDLVGTQDQSSIKVLVVVVVVNPLSQCLEKTRQLLVSEMRVSLQSRRRKKH